MKRFVDRLEGGYRVVRIRRIRRVVYTILALITIFFASAVLVANGGSLKPFYLPLDIVLTVILVMCLVWLALSFVFRNLRMRYTKRSSQKFLMASNSMKRSLALVAVVIFVGVLLVIPAFHSITKDQLSDETTVSVTEQREIHYWNTDTLGLTTTEKITIYVTVDDVNACFIEGDYGNDSDCDAADWQPVAQNENAQFEFESEGYRMYSLVLNSSGIPDVRIKATTTVSDTILGTVPLTMFIMAALSIGWVGYLYPVRKGLAAVSIYSEDYVERVSKDERFYGAEPVRKDIPKTTREPGVAPEAAVAIEPTGKVTPAKEIRLPPPPPPEEELPPPEEMVDIPYLFEQAKERVAAREFEEALGFYGAILERDPEDVAALIGKGTALASLGREDEAMENLNGVLRTDPSNKAALLWMARIFDSRENWDEALKWYDRYLGIYHGDEKQWIRHGDVLSNLGRGDIAIESYRNALKINPSNREASARLEKLKVSVKEVMTKALSRSALGDHLGALELFDRVLRIEPGNARALLGKGVAYRRLNKITSAIECLNQVLEINPENQAALLNKGALLEGQERWEEALYCYNKLLEMNPKDEEAWVKKGDVNLNLGKKRRAYVSYGEALALNPSNEDVKQRRLAIEGELEEEIDERAIEELTRVKGITRKRAELLYEAGYRSIDDLRAASTTKLKAIKGISRKTARMILGAVRAEPAEEVAVEPIEVVGEEPTEVVSEAPEGFDKQLREIPGVGPSLAASIMEAGYSSLDQIQSASTEKLSEIKGISKKKAEGIIEFLNR